MPSDPIDELFADILTPEEIEQSDNIYRKMVDRLARALARTDPVNVVTGSDWWCDECSVHLSDRNDIRDIFPHDTDCAYAWAVEYTTTLNGGDAA